MSLTDGWRLSVGTLTALPVRAPGRVDPRVARQAILLAPLAVLPLGALVVAVGLGGRLAGLPALVTGLLCVAGLVAGSRALHVDGLSDTVDGLTASYDPQRSLQVMRSGTSGPAGGAAVLLVLGLQAASFASLAATARGVWVAGLLVCLSRCALCLTCARGVRGARPEGLGLVYAGSVPRTSAAASWAAAAVLAALVVAWSGGAWWRGPLAVLLALLVVAALVHRTTKRFGGVTGDVFGAAVELALATLLVAVL